MNISIVIPTFNRMIALDECLNSIRSQKRLPLEVLIIDDSDNNEIEKLIKSKRNEFEKNEICLKYVRNRKEKSLTVARNIGIKNSVGDIILFLDSDVALDENYIVGISEIFLKYPNAFGVQGHIKNTKCPKCSFFRKQRCLVLPSGNTTYPCFLNGILHCQWLSGSNSAYKRKILDRFRFDEKLKLYSYGEDKDLSYRIFKKYPNSLFMTSNAKLIHKTSNEGRLDDKRSIEMKCVYNLYFFYKCMDQHIKNKVAFILYALFHTIENFELKRISVFIMAHFLCLKHRNEIKQGDLDFFNKLLR